jgi:hypothetical protein
LGLVLYSAGIFGYGLSLFNTQRGGIQ